MIFVRQYIGAKNWLFLNGLKALVRLFSNGAKASLIAVLFIGPFESNLRAVQNASSNNAFEMPDPFATCLETLVHASNLAAHLLTTRVERNIGDLGVVQGALLQTPSQGHTIVSVDQLPALQDEMNMARNLIAKFSHTSAEHRRMVFEGVILGEQEYRILRERAGLPPLPPQLFLPTEQRNHSYWEIAVQAFVVAVMQKSVARAKVTALTMAYLLHDIDDVVDRIVANILAENLVKSVGSTDAIEVWVDHLMRLLDGKGTVYELLRKYFPKGYEEFYRLCIEETKQVIPDFDVTEFERATARMIIGSTFTHPMIPSPLRDKIREAHHKTEINRLRSYPSTRRLVGDESSNLFHALTVKSLSDAIFTFYLPNANKAYVKLLSYITAYGLYQLDAHREVKTLELDPTERLSPFELQQTTLSSLEEFGRAASKREFTLEELKLAHEFLLAYIDAFRGQLLDGNLSKDHQRLTDKLEAIIQVIETESTLN